MPTCTVRATFVRLSRQIGLRGPSDSHGPRLHDFRHRFAVQTLVRWYQEDVDVERHLPELSTYLGHVKVSDTYWYLSATPELLGLATQRLEQAPKEALIMTTTIAFPTLLETFFTDRLVRQKRASPHTIASYRDTFSLLLRFTQQRLGKAPSALALDDLDAPLISAFLDDLEQMRGTSARSRNVRLAAIHSFFHYAALRAPSHSGLIQRVLAIPSKRYDRTPIAFLTDVEIDALLAAPDQHTWLGRRDRTLLLLAVQTGLRVSELSRLCWQDITLGTGAHVRCQGKGRKERCTPLRKDAINALRAWQREQQSRPEEPVFLSTRGGPLRRDGVAYLLTKYVAAAQQHCPSLQGKRVTPHVLRHSAAMTLLHSGVDSAVIAMWLGHETMDTIQMYLHASLALKQQALDKTTPVNGKARPLPAG